MAICLLLIASPSQFCSWTFVIFWTSEFSNFQSFQPFQVVEYRGTNRSENARDLLWVHQVWPVGLPWEPAGAHKKTLFSDRAFFKIHKLWNIVGRTVPKTLVICCGSTKYGLWVCRESRRERIKKHSSQIELSLKCTASTIIVLARYERWRDSHLPSFRGVC